MNSKILYIAAALALATLLLLSGLDAKRTTVLAPSVATSSLPSASLSTTTPSAQPPPIHTVGGITWHAENYLGKDVRIQGYLLKKGAGYGIFSDEMTGNITRHDLSVTGIGIARMQLKQKYILEGTLVANASSNTSRALYALEVSKISWQN
ncbi:MAG: hypothetical protein ACYCZZ_01770 [Minisyncoccota bacterium]